MNEYKNFASLFYSLFTAFYHIKVLFYIQHPIRVRINIIWCMMHCKDDAKGVVLIKNHYIKISRTPYVPPKLAVRIRDLEKDYTETSIRDLRNE